MATSKAKKFLVAGLCAVTLGGGIVSMPGSAEAQYRGYGHGGYQQHSYDNRRRHRGGNRGAAVAAGVVGGLALGALAAGAARPAYAAPIAPGYAVPAYGEECHIVRRKFVDDWGRTIIRREQVCD